MSQAAVAPALAGLACALAVGALAFREHSAVLVRLGEGSRIAGRPRTTRVLLARLGRRASTPRGRGRLAERIPLSGWNVSVEEMLGAKAVAAGLGLAIALASPPPGAALAPLLVLACHRVPDLALGVAAGRRMAVVDREIPQLLDLLAAASAAGLTGQAALRRAVGAMEGPLADELSRVLVAVDLGAHWREELVALADRSRLPDLRRTVAALTRTESLGASLADATASLAAQVREARRAAVTERARKAPVKMLFPLVFLVLPAFLLLTVVPVLLTTLQSIR